MLVEGKAKLVGFRQGVKNDRAWGNVYLDDPVDLMERVQLFCRPEVIPDVGKIPLGSSVLVQMRLYTGGKNNDLGGRLISMVALSEEEA